MCPNGTPTETALTTSRIRLAGTAAPSMEMNTVRKASHEDARRTDAWRRTTVDGDAATSRELPSPCRCFDAAYSDACHGGRMGQ